MDDSKLYAKDDNELEWLLKIVKGFRDNIGIEFELSKCAKATFKRGRLEKSDHVRLDEETMIKNLKKEKVYKYLDAGGIQHATMKQKLKKELIRRTRLILKTELNSKNRITAINTLAIPVITYSFNIIDWNLGEEKRLDVKITKMMRRHSMHHPKADIHRLYLPRSSRGKRFDSTRAVLKNINDWSLLIPEFIR